MELTLLFYFILYGLYFMVVGLPWAYALLPRQDWGDRGTILPTALALGPLLASVWMFFIGQFLSFDLALIGLGVVLLAGGGSAVAWFRRAETPINEAPPQPEPLTNLLKLIIGMMAAAFVLHIAITAYWPFIYYDTQWTYGYNPRVYLLANEIPDFIHYYPNLLHLTYGFGQFVYGELNDYVSRVAIPWMVLASVAMAYLLGWRVWGKRSIGVLTAALWFLTPIVFFWAFSGDLEHTVPIYFTGATAFFILAWRTHSVRYAVLAGLMFSGALWSKPTGGAWALGVMLLVGYTFVQYFIVRGRGFAAEGAAPPPENPVSAFIEKFKIAAITGTVSIPIGVMWYVRNILLGHEPITFPPDFYNDLAERGGQQFYWIFAIFIVAGGMGVTRWWAAAQQGDRMARFRMGAFFLGFAITLVATLPSIPDPNLPLTFRNIANWVGGQHEAGRMMSVSEGMLAFSGIGMMIWALFPLWTQTTEHVRTATVWTVLLIAPFAITYFFLYSYHARLAFTVMPAMASLVAALIDGWMIPYFSQTRQRQRLLYIGTVGLCLVGPVVAAGFQANYQFLEGIDTEQEKYELLNPSLMDVLPTIYEYRDSRPEDDVFVIHPIREQRIRYFFPELSTVYNWEVPITFDEMKPSADIVFGGSTQELMWAEVGGQYPNQLSQYQDLGKHYWDNPLRVGEDIIWAPLQPLDEASGFSHDITIYAYDETDRALTLAQMAPMIMIEDATWDALALLGVDLRNGEDQSRLSLNDGVVDITAGETVGLQFYWQRAEAVPTEDVKVAISVVNADERVVYEYIGPIAHGLLDLPMMAYPDILPDRLDWAVPAELTPGVYSLHISLDETSDETIMLDDIIRVGN